jgi:hypothetical protein
MAVLGKLSVTDNIKKRRRELERAAGAQILTGKTKKTPLKKLVQERKKTGLGGDRKNTISQSLFR